MRPNVILINCDDLGYGDLGCYGSTRHDTPAIDRLARSGVLLTDFYMASPVCSPSRAAMLTGRYPSRIGFGGRSTGGLGGVLYPGMGVGLAPSEVTIARMLRDAGYSTLAVGKWHCGDQPDFVPTNHGFDEWFGLPYSNDMGMQVDGDGMPSLDELNALLASRNISIELQRPPLPLMEGTQVIEQQPDQTSLTARYTQRCVNFIASHTEAPFFLYLAHMYVHVPLYVEDRFRHTSRNGAYGAAVASLDWSTDVILRTLDELDLTENTLVMFTSDNGALRPGPDGTGSNAPLRSAKATTWEGGQRVPFIASWPGRIPADRRVSTPASALDLLPTLAALCDAEVPSDRTLDGEDISAVLGLDGPAVSAERPFFYIWDGSIEAVRIGRWKLHVRKRRRELCELYDLVDDIGETTDVAAAHPEIVERLAAYIETGRSDLGDEALGIIGRDVRPIGRVDEPVTLTSLDPHDPCIVAEYDLPHRG